MEDKFEFEKEEMADQVCQICKGAKIYDKKTCFHCKGKGTTKWPKRCGNDCSKCSFPLINPKFIVGDRFVVVAQGIGATGQKGTITEVKYEPCTGNYYTGKLDDGIIFGDSDANAKVGGGYSIEKIGRVTTLFEFGGGSI